MNKFGNDMLLYYCGTLFIIMFWKSKIYWFVILITILIGLSIILPLYFQSEKDELDATNNIFTSASTIVQNDITNTLDNFINGLLILSLSFGTLGNFSQISKTTFDKLTDTNIYNTSLFTISYDPIVYHADRTNFETFFSEQLNQTIVIKKSFSNLSTIISDVKDFYVPVGYTNFPTDVNGIDLYQLPDRFIAINNAFNGISSVSNVSLYLSAQENKDIIVIFTPVTDNNGTLTAVLGLVLFIDNFFSSISNNDFNIDISLIYNNELLYSTKYTEIEHIYNNKYINNLNYTFLNRYINIIVSANQNFDNLYNNTKIDTLLIINICLLLAVLCLITYLFYVAEKSKKNIIQKVNDANRITYNKIVSYFSHEIRNPLNTIYSMLHYIEPLDNDNKVIDLDDILINDDENVLYKFTGTNMKMLYNSIYRIKHFVDEMLEFQKMSNNKMYLSKNNINIIEFCQTILEQQTINCSNVIQLQLLTSTEIIASPIIYTDSIRLSQIMLNGLSNAIKFTKTGYIHIRLYTITIQNHKYLSIEIINSGIGLGDIDTNNLFIPFGQINTENKEKKENYSYENPLFNYDTKNINMNHINKIINSTNNYQFNICYDKPGDTTEQSVFSKQSGTGMGMPISRMLSIVLGGYLTIYDEYVDGSYKHTIFHSIISINDTDIIIHISDTNKKPYYKKHTEPPGRIYNNIFNNMDPNMIKNSDINILIIDDVPDNLRTGQMIFSKLGYNIDSISDGIYIDYGKINNYNIILLDIVMIHSSGLDICQKIINKGYNGIILATTGNITDGDIVLYKKYGFNGVYGKPFQIRKTNDFFRKILITKEWDILV